MSFSCLICQIEPVNLVPSQNDWLVKQNFLHEFIQFKVGLLILLKRYTKTQVFRHYNSFLLGLTEIPLMC